MSEPGPTRRDFLSGRALRSQLEQAGRQVADALGNRAVPTRGPALMLRTAAMATDFDVMLNPDGPSKQVSAASEALDEVARLEQLYSVYRDDSELSDLNRRAATEDVTVAPLLYQLLKRSRDISQKTGGAFNPVAGRLIQLWREARRERRLPDDSEILAAIQSTATNDVLFDDLESTIRFSSTGPQFDLGAIGKGFAVDRAGEILNEHGVEDWLVHGGKSSARVRGGHAGHDGWPIALQNPLLPDRPFLTLLLKDAALSTSGTAVQWYRCEGKRYGHILDPRKGWPIETMLSVSVIAPDAALADALSTAFFILGVENTLLCCDNFPDVGVILFPLPGDGRTLAPILHRIPPDRVFFTDPA